MPNQIMRIYDGGGANNSLMDCVTGAAWIVLVAGANAPEVIPTGDHENIQIWLMHKTAASEATLALIEHNDPVGTLATVNRVIEGVWSTTDQAVTTDQVVWGLATGTEEAAKGLACISVTPNVYLDIVFSVNSEADESWYMTYSLGHAPLANFYD